METSGLAVAKRRPSSCIPAVVALASEGRSFGFASGIAIDPWGAMHANTSGIRGSMRAATCSTMPLQMERPWSRFGEPGEFGASGRSYESAEVFDGSRAQRFTVKGLPRRTLTDGVSPAGNYR